MARCNECHGTGKHYYYETAWSDSTPHQIQRQGKCPKCGGSGEAGSAKSEAGQEEVQTMGCLAVVVGIIGTFGLIRIGVVSP